MTDDWFDADTWPIEAAIAWLLYGDKRLAGIEAGRQHGPSSKPLSFRARLIKNEQAAARYEVRPGSLYRANIQNVSSPCAKGALHPIDCAIKEALSILRAARPAVGFCGNSTQRTPIPPKTWKFARLIDDEGPGVLLRVPRENTAWRHIDVPAAPFRMFPAKRGRRPLGLGQKSPGGSIKTSERLQRNERRMGLASAEQRGRRPGSHNVVR